jgi:hypothetical protein
LQRAEAAKSKLQTLSEGLRSGSPENLELSDLDASDPSAIDRSARLREVSCGHQSVAAVSANAA